MSHALLSPSAASRWLACTPSARLEATFPDSTSQAAEEGTLAHELAEGLLTWYNGTYSEEDWKAFKKSLQNDPLYCNEMAVHVADYAGLVQEAFAAMGKGAEMLLETKLDLSAWAPESFGTADVLLLSNKKLHLIDLKYGKGVPVFAQDNKQLMLYALGALTASELFYDIEEVEMSICQIRLDSFTTFTMSANELRAWGEEVLRPKALEAFAGEGEFIAGKHCGFCRVAGSCKALAAFNLALISEDFKPAGLLEDAQVSAIMLQADSIRKWLTAVEEKALADAVAGKQWPDLKLVEGRSNRQITDAAAAGKALEAAGYKPHMLYSEPQLFGISILEKAIGKKEVTRLLDPFLRKPPGKPALVSLADKRGEWSPSQGVAADFD